MADRGGDVRLAGTTWPKQEDIGALIQPGVAGAQSEHMRFAEGRDRGELEGGERLALGETGLGQVPCNASGGALRQLMLTQGGQMRAAPQPSLSARSAKLCQSRPMVGRRKVVSISGSWAASTSLIRRRPRAAGRSRRGQVLGR